MDEVFTLEFSNSERVLTIKQDDSTDYKDFIITESCNQQSASIGVEINISVPDQTIMIDGIKLEGLALKAFKDFINKHIL